MQKGHYSWEFVEEELVKGWISLTTLQGAWWW
jgi:hypothetical protein